MAGEVQGPGAGAIGRRASVGATGPLGGVDLPAAANPLDAQAEPRSGPAQFGSVATVNRGTVSELGLPVASKPVGPAAEATAPATKAAAPVAPGAPGAADAPEAVEAPETARAPEAAGAPEVPSQDPEPEPDTSLQWFRRIDVNAAETPVQADGAVGQPGFLGVFTMLAGEALSAYRSIRDAGRALVPDELQGRLLDRFGIASDKAEVDGFAALISRDTGHVVALDTDRDGAFDLGGLDYRTALLDAGIDPDWQPDPEDFDRPLDAVIEIGKADDQRKDEERRRLDRLALRQGFESPGPLGLERVPGGQGKPPSRFRAGGPDEGLEGPTI